MANEETKTLPESWAMLGGDGPLSYAQNSSYQKGAFDASKTMIDDGIKDKLDFNTPGFHTSNAFRIADFGCSAGPNTFFAMENIIEAVEQKYHTQLPTSPPLEFQAFFNDVPGNDFNTLFRTLPSDRKYFAFGAPGSFHGRVFPKCTLHFAFSSCAFHWLSEVPIAVLDRKSPAWNKGSIYCSGISKEVAGAYLDQFTNDMDAILNARAEEIVGGGLMIIIISALPDGILMSQTEVGKLNELFGTCLTEMANLGEISEERVDSFNLPMYFPTAKELEDIINRNGNFSIERMATLANPITKMAMKPSTEYAVKRFRAIHQGLLKEHFGSEDVVDKMIQNYAKKLDADNFTFNVENHRHNKFFVLLKRNI